ncbi:DUF3883 domain-containing protein [Clostridium ljungdahlii]|uniref:Protein NO VEIN C-terminal domain-containing protein n=1 Tax=Clostridium ljungdahlii TaxID=1538 RepID=A0A168MHH7_9CLOT|nr:DUF3883 domain-containing protein [Clostridium ljungdahlii]OAA84699.1 hypothetical protein WY13_02598 [Clostridium ljungdahlii]
MDKLAIEKILKNVSRKNSIYDALIYLDAYAYKNNLGCGKLYTAKTVNTNILNALNYMKCIVLSKEDEKVLYKLILEYVSRKKRTKQQRKFFGDAQAKIQDIINNEYKKIDLSIKQRFSSNMIQSIFMNRKKHCCEYDKLKYYKESLDLKYLETNSELDAFKKYIVDRENEYSYEKQKDLLFTDFFGEQIESVSSRTSDFKEDSSLKSKKEIGKMGEGTTEDYLHYIFKGEALIENVTKSGKGYDLEANIMGEKKFIEVKSTKKLNGKITIYMTRKELEEANNKQEKYKLFILRLLNNKPYKLYIISNPIKLVSKHDINPIFKVRKDKYVSINIPCLQVSIERELLKKNEDKKFQDYIKKLK